MIRRLKIKFVCINMLIVTAMLLVIFGLVLHNTDQDMEQQGYRTIEVIQNLPVGKAHPRGEINSSYFILYELPQGERYVASYGQFTDYPQEDLLAIGQAARELEDARGVLRAYDLRFSRKSTPAGDVTVFLDIAMEGRMLEGLIKNCVQIYLASFVLFLIVSILLAQWAIRPVDKAWKSQRQFVADASHELKTPLTVIMTNAEILRDRGEDPFAENILTMSRQMRGLVEGLLDLARLDNGVVQTTFAEVNFSTLVENCLLPFEPVFFEQGMSLETAVEEQLFVHGSESHLRQVVDILLDNAAKYGSAERPVGVSLTRQGSHVQLCVSTGGEALSPAELKNIFNRFYRVDKVRAMSQSYGLGLSIARSIVTEHRGKIWAESRLGGNFFCVQLPSHHVRVE